MKILILKGLPGSGKTTFAREFCSQNKDWVRVNRDDLRNMRGEYWAPKQENMITEWEQQCVLTALMIGKNVIIDATNLNQKYLEATKKWLKEKFVDLLMFETKFFDCPLEECIKRDLKRPNSVGEKVIMKMYNDYLKPKTESYQFVTGLPYCVICDLDGTLALFEDRNPYDRDFENDTINKPVKDIFENSRKTYGVGIILSGRSDKFLEATKRWLIMSGVKYDLLIMRKEGDMRKDCIVKKEMFDKLIKGIYNPVLILDDRDQVVQLWRNMGLTCFQVDYGNF